MTKHRNTITDPRITLKVWLYDKPETVKNRKKVGLLIAGRKDTNSNIIGIGWSFCSKKDEFSPEMAERVAYGRFIKGTGRNIKIPYRMELDLMKFEERCYDYFKKRIAEKGLGEPRLCLLVEDYEDSIVVNECKEEAIPAQEPAHKCMCGRHCGQ